MCALRLDLRENVFSQPGTSQRWTLTAAVETWGVSEGGVGGIFGSAVGVCLGWREVRNEGRVELEWREDYRCGGGGLTGNSWLLKVAEVFLNKFIYYSVHVNIVDL